MRPELWKGLLFFFCGGGAGGASSALLEVLPAPASGLFPGLLYVAVWTAGVGAAVAMGLVASQHRYLRRPIFSGNEMGRMIPWALGAGVLAGTAAQGFYVLLLPSPVPGGTFWWPGEGLRVLCWGLLGLLLGGLMTWIVPNLRRLYGVLGGFAGGLFGGLGFVASGFFVGGWANRIVGATLLGAGIGLAITVAEQADRAREQRSLREIPRSGERATTRPPLRPTGLVLHYTPRERALVKLGPTPVTFGTSPEATVYLRPQGNLLPLSATVMWRGGEVILKNELTGGTRSLEVGDTAQIGTLRVEVV